METQWLKIALLIVVYLVSTAVKAWITMQDQPAGPDLQRVVMRKVQHEAGLRPLYDQAMADGQLSFREARALLSKADELDRIR